MRDPEWSLIQFTTAADPEPRAGILVRGEVHEAPQGLPPTVLGMLENWPAVSNALKDIDAAATPVVAGARLVAPVTYPRKVICSGANYYDHAEEMGTARPDPDATPFFFLKAPTTTVVGPYDEIEFPVDDESKTDWEIELAVVIGVGGHRIAVADALAHIAGYAVANDLSARGYFPRPDAVFPPFGFDWLAHKSLDGSCPLGPGVVPAWLVDDPQNLAMRLTVNGDVKQDSSTSGLVIGLAKLIAAASRLVTLEPGDVILTGTPAGVGMPRGTFLSDGDVVAAEIEGIGRIENRLVAP